MNIILIKKMKIKEKYLSIPEIEESLKNNKNKNLISLRKEVDKEIKKLIQKEKSIYEDKKQKKEKDKLKEDGEKKLFKSTRDEYIIFISYLTKQRKITK